MGITKRFTGYNNEDFQVGHISSSGWKEKASDVKNGDLTNVECNDVPTYTDESNKIEIKKVGIVKRNPVNYIGAGKAMLNIMQLLYKGYMNYEKRMIEATVGKLEIKVDGGGELVKATVTATSAYTLSTSAGSADLILPDGEQVQLIAIKDENLNIVDMDTVISNDGSGNLTVAGALASNIDVTGATSYTIEAVAWINVDKLPEDMIDFVARRASKYGLDYDPESDGAYDGAKAIKFKNCLGSASFTLPLQEQGTVEYSFSADDYEYIDPTPPVIPATIAVSGTFAGSASGQIIVLGKDGFSETISFTTGATPELTASAIASAISGSTCGLGGSAAGATVTVSAGTREYAELYLNSTEGDYLVTYGDVNDWKFANNNDSVSPARAMFDAGVTGSTMEEKTVQVSGTVFNGGTECLLSVNGNIYRYVVQNGDDEQDIAAGLEALISADIEIRYSSSVTTDTITITATDVAEKLNIDFEVLDAMGTSDIAAAIVVIAETTSPEWDDEAHFFKLHKIKIGEAGSDMMDFCEVASLAINFERTIVDIKSICAPTGRRGWNNTEYTLYLDVETTDIDAERVYDKFYKFKNNESFALNGVDKDSGFGFFFPKCKIENFEAAEIDGLQGHKFTINVNFDPKKTPVLALQQLL